MPRIDCLKVSEIEPTARVKQLAGMFDLPVGIDLENDKVSSKVHRSEVAVCADIPIEEQDWSIGLIVGPSGSGKTTILKEWFGNNFACQPRWPKNKCVIDAFPKAMGIKPITELLTAVGFASPPSWLRPFHVLSNGEQFRANMARVLAASPKLAVVDEYTSVVDRTVAQIGSAAIAKMVRRVNKAKPGSMQFVAAGCHYDVVDWLCPDWVYDTGRNAFQWRRERRRPQIDLRIQRVARDEWGLFRRHHYLSGAINPCAVCFMATVDGQPAAFTAALSFPHPRRPGWREHRTVCLPDFQGVGIGTALSEFVAGVMKTAGKPYRSTTSHPAMIGHRARSPLWKMTRKPSMVRPRKRPGTKNVGWKSSFGRLTASFEFTGPVLWEHRSLIAKAD